MICAGLREGSGRGLRVGEEVPEYWECEGADSGLGTILPRLPTHLQTAAPGQHLLSNSPILFITSVQPSSLSFPLPLQPHHFSFIFPTNSLPPFSSLHLVLSPFLLSCSFLSFFVQLSHFTPSFYITPSLSPTLLSLSPFLLFPLSPSLPSSHPLFFPPFLPLSPPLPLPFIPPFFPYSSFITLSSISLSLPLSLPPS